GRISIGLTAIVVAVCAMIQVACGLPSPPDWSGVFAAGGLIGYAVANPLTAALTQWVTIPLMVLLGFFGLLVVTATPVAAIPRRVRQGIDWITGNDVGREEEEPPARSRSPRKARKGETKAAEPGAFHGDEAFGPAPEPADASADGAPAAAPEAHGA